MLTLALLYTLLSTHMRPPVVYTPQYNPYRIPLTNQLGLDDLKCMWYTVTQRKAAQVARVIFNKSLRVDQNIDVFLMGGVPVACMISTRSCTRVIAEKLCIKDTRLIKLYNAGPLMRGQLNTMHKDCLVLVYAKGYHAFARI